MPPKKKSIDREKRIQRILRLLDILMYEDSVDVVLSTKFDPAVKVMPSGIPLFTMGTRQTVVTITQRK